jgi:hypothetical protein
MLFEVVSRKSTELASGQRFQYPNWSRDGRYLYVVGYDSQNLLDSVKGRYGEY